MCEKLGKRAIILIDITDVAPRAATNALYHGLELAGLFASSAGEMQQKKYYQGGYKLGRAFDILIQ